MLIVITIAGASALAVIAYTRIRRQDPAAAALGLRALRELAAVVLVCARAVEGIIDILAGNQRLQSSPASGWGHRNVYERDYDYEEDEP